MCVKLCMRRMMSPRPSRAASGSHQHRGVGGPISWCRLRRSVSSQVGQLVAQAMTQQYAAWVSCRPRTVPCRGQRRRSACRPSAGLPVPWSRHPLGGACDHLWSTQWACPPASWPQCFRGCQQHQPCKGCNYLWSTPPSRQRPTVALGLSRRVSCGGSTSFLSPTCEVQRWWHPRSE